MATIKELKTKQFIIPIYQRNYAWSDIEIHQMIDDIINVSTDKYHIGSLVLFDKGNNYFEVTDGQQRLTTLALILFVLEEKEIRLSIRFEAREENNKILEQLKSNDDNALNNEENELIYALKRYIKPKLEEIGDEKKEFLKKNLLEKVILNENVLPETVNLHHYFERMNSRGKQLELHSVLRAKFLKDVVDSDRFKKWDKCSELNKYNVKNVEDSIIKKSLESIIEKINDLSEMQDSTQKQEDDKYNSTIDFPNFLLIALRVFKNDEDIALNDKQLLTEFGYHKNSFVVEPEGFLVFLIQLKELFDKFIIKRSHNDNEQYWVLLNDKKNTFSNTEPNGNEEENTNTNNIQQKIIKIQSMLHATYPSNSYKEWLCETLKYIWVNKEKSNSNLLGFGMGLLEKLEKYAQCKFEIHIKENLPISRGLSIPRIVFYYTDYLLWKLYFEKVRGAQKSEENKKIDILIGYIEKNKSLFQKFYFRSFSSIEHLYPQNPDNRKYINDESLNSFGNLCLISRSSNSRYSNLEPMAKREHSKNSNLNESLKQAIMFQILIDEKDWNTKQIQKHEEEIKALISHYSNALTSES